jgi:hypothetical protein
MKIAALVFLNNSAGGITNRKRSNDELAAALKGDRRVWGHVFDNLAENLEGGEIRGAGLALGGRRCDGYAAVTLCRFGG